MTGAAGGGPAGFPVVIVDDHELFSSSLEFVLRDRGVHARRVPVAHLPELAARPVGPGPALAVLDLDLGADASGRRTHGAEWVRPLLDQGWSVLIVTGTGDEQACAAAVAAGATGLVRKSSPFPELLRAVLEAAAGRPVMGEAERADWVDRHAVAARRQGELQAKLASLTPREREVLELIAEGEHAAAIAKRFVVSLATVRTQIRSIFAKLGVSSQLEAAAMLRPRQPTR